MNSAWESHLKALEALHRAALSLLADLQDDTSGMLEIRLRNFNKLWEKYQQTGADLNSEDWPTNQEVSGKLAKKAEGLLRLIKNIREILEGRQLEAHAALTRLKPHRQQGYPQRIPENQIRIKI